MRVEANASVSSVKPNHTSASCSATRACGFTVVTRADVTAAPVRGRMMIGIEGRGGEKIMARLSGLPAVMAVHSTNGKWDLIVELATQTLLELDEVIHRIRSIEGVTTSETNLLLSSIQKCSIERILVEFHPEIDCERLA